MHAGRAQDLFELVAGISPFTISSIAVEPMSPEVVKLWQLTMTHLQFVARLGLNKNEAQEGKRWWFAYPEEFELWLKEGAPGVSVEELLAYINERPLP